MAKQDEKVPALAGLDASQLQECLKLGASLQQIKDLADAGFGYDQIKQLAGTLGQAHTQGHGLTAEDLKSIITEVAAGQRKAMKPENDQHPQVSAFSYPEGNIARPKATLTREVHFNGSRETDENLTPLEIDLYNRFTGSRTARNGNWTARVARAGDGKEALIVTTNPATRDALNALPALPMVLRELLDGAAAVDPQSMAERIAELEARVKAVAA